MANVAFAAPMPTGPRGVRVLPTPPVRTRVRVHSLMLHDVSVALPSAQVAGVVYDGTGAAVVGATVVLIRQSDGLQVATTTSGADGSYAFLRDATDRYAYVVLAFSGDTLHGTTDRSLVPLAVPGLVSDTVEAMV